MTESNVVVMPTPFNVITLPETKLVPVAVRVKSALPEATEEGEIEVSFGPCGPSPVIFNVKTFEDVVSDLRTDTLMLPGLIICAAVTSALNFEFDSTLVARGIPSQTIRVPLVKLLPLADNVNPALPASIVAGFIEESVGVTTPWNPPQPASHNAGRLSSGRSARNRRSLIWNSAFRDSPRQYSALQGKV